MSITRGRTKPKMTEAQRHAMRHIATRVQRDGLGSGSSWWCAYATGDRRDAEYQAEAERRSPGAVTRKAPSGR